MSTHHPIQNPRPNRNDTLALIITETELLNDVWRTDFNNHGHPRGAFGTALADALHKKHPAIDTLTVLVEKIAESFQQREYRINGTTYPLTVGHSPLFNAVSTETRELAVEMDLIKRAQFYGNDKQVAPRAQVAKTSYWGLGDAAKQFLDMQAVRALGDNHIHQASDRNEGIGHAAGVELVKARYNAESGVRAESFVTLPHHVSDDEYAKNVFDVVAFNTADNSIVATVEVESSTDDSTHIAHDAAKLANTPGASVWCVPNKACQNQLLRSMVREGLLRPAGSDPGFPHALATNLANERIQSLVTDEKYRQFGPGVPVSNVCTFNGVRSALQRVDADVLSAQAAELEGGA